MKRYRKAFFRRICAAVLSLILILPCVAFAEQTTDRDYAFIVEDIVRYLDLYARYEEVYPEALYKEGLLKLIEKHPELYEEVMHILLRSVDEYSEYYNEEESAQLKENISGSVTGIGITFDMCDKGIYVRSVIQDTPAARGGLCVGDIIVSADGVELSGMNSDTAADHIKGAEGTTVTIGVLREGTENIIYKEMIREKIVGTSVTHKRFSDNDGELMYIKLHGFVSNTAESFKAVIDEAQSAGITNLIIDVRDNGGGLFDQAIAIADMLLPAGKTITTEDHKIEIFNLVYTAQLADNYNFDTVVLINENSASASEVLSAALRENEAATLIGEKSFGKGTIQTIADMVYGDSIKYTVGYYLTPLGNNINGIGLIPDVKVQNSTEPFEIEKYNKFRFEKVYREGDESDEIQNAKALLTAWGEYDGEINDVYDAELSRAVSAFQSATGLYPYGVLDLTTQNELYNRMKKSKVVHDDQLDAAFRYFGMERN